MTWTADTIYRFRFSPRDDNTVDTSLRISVEGGDGVGPLSWVTDASTVDAGPANLSNDDAAAVMRHLEQAIELVAKAVQRTPRQERREEPEPERVFSRPSELRLRR